MKLRTTKKEVRQTHAYTIEVLYCGLQHLLSCENPIAYTTRAEGWGADVYEFGTVAIATGAAPFGDVKPSYDLVRAYDRRAEAVTRGIRDWDLRKKRLRKLIDEFITEVIPAERGGK